MDVKPKGLIQRVLDFAVAEFERRSRPPPPVEDGVEPFEAYAPVGEEPRVPLEPVQPAPSAVPPSAAASERQQRAPAAGLHLTRGQRGALKVRWSVASEELERSAALIEDGAVLCLRVVSFAAGRDHVTREVQDRPSIASQGECDLTRPEEGRAVVAVGLRAGGRFVSIAHHIV
jgi:hypothetical protein